MIRDKGRILRFASIFTVSEDFLFGYFLLLETFKHEENPKYLIENRIMLMCISLKFICLAGECISIVECLVYWGREQSCLNHPQVPIVCQLRWTVVGINMGQHFLDCIGWWVVILISRQDFRDLSDMHNFIGWTKEMGIMLFRAVAGERCEDSPEAISNLFRGMVLGMGLTKMISSSFHSN